VTATDVGTEPLTSTQRKAIMLHFRRLHLDRRAWRDARLAITAALLGVERVESVTHLTRGEAGQLVRTLGRCRDCRDLALMLAWAATENPASEGSTL